MKKKMLGVLGLILASSLYAKNLPNTIENHDFEMGNLNGWKIISGTLFDESSVTSETTWWAEKIPYFQEGRYHLNGWKGGGEGAVGRLRSSTFNLQGSGWITFKLGGGKNTNLMYLEVKDADTGEVLARYGNTNFRDVGFPYLSQGMKLANMNTYKADLSKYLGKNLYIDIVDKAVNDWGALFVDDINTYLSQEPSDEYIYAENLYSGEKIVVKNYILKENSLTVDNLKSSDFYVGGTGKITMKVKGNPDKEEFIGVYSSETDQLLSQAELSKEKITFDLSSIMGKKVYLKLNLKENSNSEVVDIKTYSKGIIAKWKFDDGKGKIAKDEISKIESPIHYVFNDAVYTSSKDPQWREEGIENGALLFDGFSTWVTRENDTIEQPTEEFTVEAWVSPRVYEWGDGNKLSAIVNQHKLVENQGYILGMYRHGTWALKLGVGDKTYEVWSKDKTIEKYKWNHVIGTFDSKEGKIKIYLNGELVGEESTPKGIPMNLTSNDLLIGRNNESITLATVFIHNMFGGLIDEVTLYNKALSSKEVKSNYNSKLINGKLPKIAPENIDIDESVYNGDIHRPQYHVLPPGNWMNEPHSPVYYNGKYHLFYQQNPQGPYWHQIHWGHWVSDDMVHWKNLRPALSPEKGNLDPDGIWTGSAVLDRDGVPVLFYTAGNDSKVPNQSVALARPKDLTDENLVEWKKHPKPVIEQVKGQGILGEFRDPFVWYDKDTDMWYNLVTSGEEDRSSGMALLYTSKDLYNWEYHGDVFDGDVSQYKFLGTVWELPLLLPIGKDNQGKEKHIFFVTPTRGEAKVEIFYWIGEWDKKKLRFKPDHIEPKLFDVGDGHLTAQSGFVTPDGRTVIFSIVQGFRTPQADYEAGWAHTGALPITMKWEDEQLKIAPIKELESLRGEKILDLKNSSIQEVNKKLDNIKGDMLEIKLTMEISKNSGISVRQSQNKEEETKFIYNNEAKKFVVNREKTTLNPDARSYGIQERKVELDNQDLELHIYLDRSIAEVFINNIKKATTRMYPSRYDSLGLELIGDKNSKVKSIEIWQMKPMDGTFEEVYVPKDWEEKLERGKGLKNHDFSKGNFSGWKTTGNAFTDKHLTTKETFGGGIFYNPSRKIPGKYHYVGNNESLGGTKTIGTLESKVFTLGGKGNIDFLISGGRDIENLYVALVRKSDGKELFKQTGYDYDEYIRVRWDASEYVGEKLYIKIVDNSKNKNGYLNLDDFNVPVK